MVLTSYGVIQNSELLCPTFPSKPVISLSRNSSTFGKLPTKLSPELSYFIGYFYGGGGLKDIKKTFEKTKRFEYKLIIADEFEIQIKIIQKLFQRLFGFMPPIRYERIEKGEHTYYLNPTNKVVYLFLRTVFDFPSGSKYLQLRIPPLILNSNSALKMVYSGRF